VSRRALLLIDFQHDFLRDDGRMPVARAQVVPMIDAANQAVRRARERGDLVVAIGNEFPPGDRLMNLLRRNAALAGTDGAAWDERVDRAGARYFPKTRGDAFSNPELAAYLAAAGVDEVVLAGLQAKACVSATARGARAHGLRVRALAPAIADESDWWRTLALRRLGRLPGVTLATSYDG
jgi:nicotinamidase-related amidase